MSQQWWVVTFGVGDPVRAGCFTLVAASSYHEARMLAAHVYGENWAEAYASREAAGVTLYGLTEIPWGA